MRRVVDMTSMDIINKFVRDETYFGRHPVSSERQLMKTTYQLIRLIPVCISPCVI